MVAPHHPRDIHALPPTGAITPLRLPRCAVPPLCQPTRLPPLPGCASVFPPAEGLEEEEEEELAESAPGSRGGGAAAVGRGGRGGWGAIEFG